MQCMTIILVLFSKTNDWRLSINKLLYLENYISTFTKLIGAYLKNMSFNLKTNLRQFELIHFRHLKFLIF
jgi:hypothetical protein